MTPDWKLSGFDDTTYSISELRGNVLILDFWHRGCAWCIHAMPEIKEIAMYFQDKPVLVLGMNTDSNSKDARSVIYKMNLNYPNLKATGIPEKYGIDSFPTFVIIDQKGVIRKFHLGYSANLKDSIISEVEKILREFYLQ